MKIVTTEEFINKSHRLHDGKYNYDKVEYVNAKTKVIITCPIHGDFEQKPDTHNKRVNPSGCKKCNKVTGAWGYNAWTAKGRESKLFDGYKVYIVRCWNETEDFYKIGKTYRNIERRFYGKDFPYNYEVIHIYESATDGVAISKLENELHKIHKSREYSPKLIFNGKSECFSSIDFIKLANYVK